MARRKVRCFTAALAFLLLAVMSACTGDSNDDRKEWNARAAKKFCGVDLTSKEAKAFEKLYSNKYADTARFNHKSLRSAADEVIQVEESWVYACGIATSGSLAGDSLAGSADTPLGFSWMDNIQLPKDLSGYTFFSVGDEAFSNGEQTGVLVRCSARNPNLDPDEKHYLVGILEESESDLPRAERKKLLVTVVYPVVRKMAALVGCKEASELPVSPPVRTTTPPADARTEDTLR
ncbi:hypothetical protein ACYSUO_22360 [Streptomyces sp. UC4497]